jgi:excisionase family DNA binding protein
MSVSTRSSFAETGSDHEPVCLCGRGVLFARRTPPASAGEAAVLSAGLPLTQVLYSVPQVCELLSLRRSMVYELMARGDLLSVRIGRRRLVTARAIALFVARLEAAG